MRFDISLEEIPEEFGESTTTSDKDRYNEFVEKENEITRYFEFFATDEAYVLDRRGSSVTQAS